MKIINYIFLDDYFKINFESVKSFKIIIGYKQSSFFLKTTSKPSIFIKATKSLTKILVINIKWLNVQKTFFNLNPENLKQNNFPSKDLSFENRLNSKGIENRTEELLDYNNDFQEIKLNRPLIKFKILSKPNNFINYTIDKKHVTKIIKYKRPILKTK
ncbi:hypothetical protein [Polaribacter sp.]|uniref:hypothetical protein n=1 Tax=Polaribacter sp. TaxID=1920175 RepID=UPI0025F72BB0|nr:hypothetical protein [Polaribacter sp.]